MTKTPRPEADHGGDYGESRLFIDGALRAATGDARFDVISPLDDSVIGVAADASEADLEAAIAAARRCFDTTRWAEDLAWRLRALHQFRDGLHAARDELCRIARNEGGAPRGVIVDGPQVDIPLGMLDWVLEHAAHFQWQRDIGMHTVLGVTSRRFVRREAAGVVAAITPWNVPLQVNLAKIFPALAAGCTVVLKPAPDTPWGGAILGRIAAACPDLPPGALNVVTAADPVNLGERLTRDPRVDVVTFTGSTAVGRRIMANAAPTVKKVFLELGGKSANIVLEDADFDQALPSALGVCYHAGQGCAIATRLLVPRARLTEVEQRLGSLFAALEYGDPDAPGQILGPVISRRQRDRVLSYIELGQQEGARLLLGGGTPEHLQPGYYIEPTVFSDVTNEMRIAREEIFGPVLCVIPFEDEDDAVRIANDSIYGLSGAVWSRDRESAWRVARRLRTGTVNINGGNYYAPDAPFGGYKQSGVGREMGPEGFEEFLETKTLAEPEPG